MELETHEQLEAAVGRAEALRRRGDWAAALDSYGDILARRLRLGVMLTAADMVVVDRVSDLARLLGHTEAADHLLGGAVQLLRGVGNQNGAAYAVLKRADLALGRGDLTAAQELLTELEPFVGPLAAIPLAGDLARWEATCRWPEATVADHHFFFAMLYLSLGRLLAGLGQYGQARAAARRGLVHASAPAAAPLARQTAPHLRLLLAAALLEAGEVSEAGRYLVESGEAGVAAGGAALAVRWHELSGKQALLCGALGSALTHFQESLRLCQAGGFTRAALGAALNLAEVKIALNQTSEARALSEQTAKAAARAGEAGYRSRAEFLLETAAARAHSTVAGVPLAATVSELWHLAPERKAPQQTARRLPPVYDVPPSDNFLGLFEDRTLEFYGLLGAREWDGAESLLQALEAAFGLSDSELIALRLRFMRGLLAYYREEYARSEAELLSLVEPLGERGLRPDLWQTLRALGWCGAKLGWPASARQELAGRAQVLLEEMTESLSTTDQSIFLLNKWTAEEEDLAATVNRLSELQEELREGSRLARPWRRWRLWRALHDFLTRLDRRRADAADKQLAIGGEPDGQTGEPLTIWRRLWRHPRERATLTFLVLPDRLFVARSGWMSLTFGVTPVTRLAVRDLVRRWHESVSAAVSRAAESNPADVSRGLGGVPVGPTTAGVPTIPEGPHGVAESLAEALQLPALLQGLSRGVRALTFVPDDTLHGFPFAVLPHGGRYLVENYAVSIAYKSAPPMAAPAAARGEALAVAVTREVRYGSQHLPRLAGTVEELDWVEGWLRRRGGHVLRLDDFSPEAAANHSGLKRGLERAGFFHIACHGVFVPDRPDASGFLVAAPAGGAEVFSLRELASLNLSGLEHATLSSCWAADHFIWPGREIISLPETLCRAGASSVLGCLWVVSDAVSVSLMRRFYSYLTDFPRDEALRRAQIDCIKGQLGDGMPAETTQPLYWAGYQLYGSPAPITWPTGASAPSAPSP